MQKKHSGFKPHSINQILLTLLVLLTNLYSYTLGNNSSLQKVQNQQMSEVRTSGLVTRVIDGDTIELAGGARVRYIGIDAPESVDPRQSVQCFGVEAKNENVKLVEGKTVTLEKDISDTDKYGRLLRYVYLDSDMVNEHMVRSGYARASSYPPDVAKQDVLQLAEWEAKTNGRGLWAACSIGQ